MTRRRLTGLLTSSIALIGLVALPALEVTADTIVMYGASGRVGGVIVDEALRRGHDVIGVSRNPDSLTNDHPNFTAVAGDVTRLESMLEIIPGADAVIIAVRGIGPGNTAEEAIVSRAAKTVLEAADALDEQMPYVVQISGGTTLWKNGVWGLDDPTLEPGTARHGGYFGHWQAIETYRASSGLEWAVMTPPPATMSSTYRLGGDDVLFNAEGSSFISTEDFAFAVIDEAESRQSSGKRVTVGPPM
jgi:putative NADH-flavin reductase